MRLSFSLLTKFPLEEIIPVDGSCVVHLAAGSLFVNVFIIFFGGFPRYFSCENLQ